MAEERIKDSEHDTVGRLLDPGTRALRQDSSLSALLEMHRHIGKTESELAHLKETTDAQGKKLGRIEKLLIYVAGIVTAHGLFGKTLLDVVKILWTTPTP